MRPQEEGAHTGADPSVPLAELLHWLSSATLPVLFSIVLGVAFARTARRAGLHWSWALVALAPLVAIDPTSTLAGCSPALLGLSACLCGRRWQRQDLDAGLDLACAAGSRTAPLSLLARVGRTLASRWAHRSAAQTRPHVGELRIGVDEHGRGATIPIGGQSGGSHVLITGATGSGKTVTQAAITTRAIAGGMGAIVIDPKGDRGMREALERSCADHERDFIAWSPQGPSIYNPYSRGSDTEIADKALASERFTEPHYQRQAQRYLGHVVRALRAAGKTTSLRAIVDHLDPGALELLVRTLAQPEHPTHRYLDTLTPRQQSDLAGVRDRLAILAESDVGAWLDPAAGKGNEFDLLDAVRERAVVYFALDADARPLLAQMLGGAIVQDLQTVVAAQQASPLATVAVIDEFSSLGAEHVVRLFARARSAGVNLLLGTQELADLRVAGHERLLEQVLGNLSVLVAHRQVVPDSATLIARMSGTRGAWRTSIHGHGRTTRTRVAEPVLAAERLVQLPPGSAAVLDLQRGARARVVRVERPRAQPQL
jgi:type IV secretory pathway TraG/TraD family ATPase VirD4